VNQDDWNRRYSGKDLVGSAEPNRFLVEEVAGLEPGRALDLAAGEGRNAIWLAEQGWSVEAVDFSEAGLERARLQARERGVEIRWVLADLLDFVPATEDYDLVLLFYLQIPWEQMRGVIRRGGQAVAPGGTFLLVGHDRINLEEGWGGPKSPAVLYTPDQVAGELVGLTLREAARRRRPVEDADEGPAVAIDCLVRAEAPS
jgi:2-polyprenyl-3-methyl-5-hydroxy-6-metoxy-1,4-benzoquinol methylase